MICITLDDAKRSELLALRRTDLPARSRDRLEMVPLSAAGWSAPKIAEHLGCCGRTVRAALKGYRDRGTAALTPGRSGPPPDQQRRERVTGLLKGLLRQRRCWTAAQLAEALAPHGIDIGPRQARRYLRLMGAGYRRTANSPRHQQDPAKVARAKVVLGSLKKKPGRAS
jgi:putative transposase